MILDGAKPNTWRDYQTRFKRSAKRKAILKRLPLCLDPFEIHRKDGVSMIAAQVHHIESLQRRPDLAYVLKNLAPLCTACHARIEAMEKKNNPTSHLFMGKIIAER